MRTVEEMLRDALTQRNGLLEQNKDPTEATFTVTDQEHCFLKMLPYSDVRMDHQQERFCGMKVSVVRGERR